MSGYKEPNVDFVMLPDAYFDALANKWHPVIKVEIYASWLSGYPVASTVIYHPNEFDGHFEAEVFAKQFIENTNV